MRQGFSPRQKAPKRPGMIKNSSLLKQSSTYLKGTGQTPGLEAEYIDTYLKAGLTEGKDFVFFT